MKVVVVKKSSVWMWLIILLAFGLRTWAIDRQDIWGDEAVSIQLCRQDLAQVVAGGAETVPPLYHLLLFLWLRLAGTTPLAIRFLSAAFSTLAVPLVYLLGRQIFGRPAAGGLAALLAAVSPALIYYAQEARVYGVLVFLTAASLCCALRVMHTPRRPGPWVAYALTSLAAGYTHYYAFFVVLAQNLVVLPRLVRRRRWRGLGRWLTAQTAIAVGYLPWVVVQAGFLTGKASGRFDEWTLGMAGRIAEQTLLAFSAGLAVTRDAALLIAVPFALFALVALFSPARRSAGKRLVTAALLVTLAMAWLVNPIMPFFFPRYLLLVSPAFYLLVAWGVSAAGRRWRLLVVAATLLLLAGNAYGLHSYYTDDAFLKGRYGQMVAYIQDNARPGDGLVLVNGLQQPLFEYYRPDGLPFTIFPHADYSIADPRTGQDLAALAEQHPRLWVVRFGNPAEYDPEGILHRWLSARSSKAYSGGWVDSDLSLYVTSAAGAEGIQHPLSADLGGLVTLLGYSLGAEQVAPGETLLLTLYWQAQRPIPERYTVFTHLLDFGGQVRGQMDSEPQGGGLPTDRWQVGEVVRDNYALEVDADATAGTHALEVGMYLWATGDRLSVLDADGAPPGDFVLLGTVEVEVP